MRARGSLSWRLYWTILGVILVAVIVQGVTAFHAALMSADDLFDYHMQQMALSLQSSRPLVDNHPLIDGINRNSDDEVENFDFAVQIWTRDGVRIYQSTGRVLVPAHQVLGFSNVHANGRDYRVYSVRSGDRVIQVAQDLYARQHRAWDLALRTVTPILLMVPAMLLAAGWVVRHSLRPVQAVRRQVASRRGTELSPLDESGVPQEIQPLVVEFNGLLKRVRTAFDAQRYFVADAAHELRSPLAALRLQAQGLRRAQDEAGRRQAEERLIAGIDRATRLVTQLLELARHQNGEHGRTRMDQVPLADLARSVIAMCVEDAAARRIDLGFVDDDKPKEDRPLSSPVVQGNRDALTILLRNLIENALKYAPEGGRVDVGLTASGIQVEDNGPGISDVDRERVFDRFHRGSNIELSDRYSDGCGLGLAIVRTIADQHRARVRLSRSERLGGLRVDVDFEQLGYRG